MSILARIGPIERFGDTEELISFAGLAYGVQQSNGTNHDGLHLPPEPCMMAGHASACGFGYNQGKETDKHVQPWYSNLVSLWFFSWGQAASNPSLFI